MIVKIDNIYFTVSNIFFMDYLICNCLRFVIFVVIIVFNIYIKLVVELFFFCLFLDRFYIEK